MVVHLFMSCAGHLEVPDIESGVVEQRVVLKETPPTEDRYLLLFACMVRDATDGNLPWSCQNAFRIRCSAASRSVILGECYLGNPGE